MSNSKKLFLISIIILSMCTTACWDRRELDRLAIATCVGIDKGQGESKVKMIVEIILPQNVNTPGGGGGGGKPSEKLVVEGKTAFDAARNFLFESDRKVYFAHNPILLFSEEIAQEGILSSFDFFVRDPEHRRNVWILVSEESAEELIGVQTVLDPVTGRYLEKLIEETGPISETAIMDVQGFLERLMSPTSAPYCSLIKTKGEEKNKSMELVGTAIFKKDKMVGKFNRKESRGLLWVLGEVKGGIITVPCEKEFQIALEINHAKSKIIPSIVNNNLKITVEITEEGNLGQQECTVDLTLPEAWSSLEKKKAEAIRQEVLTAIKKAQELNTDVFAFGEAFYRKYPTLWQEQIAENWDDFFPELEVEVLVKAKLRRSGMISKPAIPQNK
ncbi:MAG: Ger(x)C family spore germination protein [Peptococcales bacterium]|jgi:spore germination protein KC